MRWRHWLALIGVLFIAGSPSAPFIAENYWPVFLALVSCGLICLSVAAIVTPNEG